MTDIVEQYVNQEKIDADLFYQLVDSNSPKDNIRGSGTMEDDYVNLKGFEIEEFAHLRHSPLPKEIREQINRMQTDCNFGVFPVLSRAWASVDMNLFLWNFENNKDLAYYDAIKQTITKVELCKVKPALFEPPVKFLLLVVTVEELVILAVSFFNENQGVVDIDYGFGDPNIYLIMQEVHTMPLDGSLIEQICCTADGRIFFSCEDGLYELTYYFDIWGNRHFKKSNLTKGFFSNLTSVFVGADKIKQISCDESRHILYTLHDSSKIVVYDMGERGDSFRQVCSYSGSLLQSQIGDRFSLDYDLLKNVISISAIPSTQFMYLNLVATLKSGCRVYFTCSNELFMERGNNRFSQMHLRPLGLRIVHFRFSPMPISNFISSCLTTYYTKAIDDVTIVAFGSPNTNISEVYALSSANFTYSERFQESIDLLPNDQHIWSIEPAEGMPVYEREFVADTRSGHEIELVPSPTPRTYTRQHSKPLTEFHVITSASIDTFVHLQPVESFKRILQKFGPDSRQMNMFLKLHKEIEVCIMALILMANDEVIDASLKEMSLRVFVANGGQASFIANVPSGQVYNTGLTPHSTRNINDTSVSLQQNPRVFSSTPSHHVPLNHGDAVMDSGHHTLADISNISFTSHGHTIDGFHFKPSNRSRAIFSYFSRIVFSIWHKRVCHFKNNTYISGISLELVRDTLRHVCGLHRVIEGYALFTGAQYGGGQNASHAVEALKQEKDSVKKLCDLMLMTKEYLALWQIILENNFHATISNLQLELRAHFQTHTFSQMVALPDSNGLELISALVHYYLGDEAKTAMINERLSNECPRLFTNDDANVLKATELLSSAQKASSLKERRQLVNQAIAIFKRHAKRVNLIDIANLLKQMNHFVGIADLAISCAAAVDPRNLALNAYYRRLPEGEENEETRIAIQKRNEIYTFLIDILDFLHGLSGKDESAPRIQAQDMILSPATAEIECGHVIEFILENNDELCHVYLFRFLVEKGLEGFLIQKKNPLFERYICREIENGGSAEFFDLLWRYYKGTESFAKAARLLYELAIKRMHKSNMDKKLEFLSQALICINSAPESPQNSELRQKIRDWLDVGLVQQKARDILRSARADTFDGEMLKETLEALDEHLLTLGDLLQVANRFGLSEIKTAVYDCAGIEKNQRV